jgi:6-phosphogluconolactonase
VSERRVVVAGSRDELAELVADKFVVRVRKICKRQGFAHVVLTGGTVAADIHRAIAQHPNRASVDWSVVHLWWGDERFVPRGDPDRNDQAAIEVLFGHLPLDPSHLHTFPTSDEVTDIDDAASWYAEDLGRHAAPGAPFPDFDVAFAGVGPDGHVLSVFPGSTQAAVTGEGVVAVTDSPKPPRRRLTMTLPLLNRSRRVWLVASGAEKSSAIGLALAGASVVDVPASGLRGTQSTKVFIDDELASGVPTELVARTRFWSADDERADYVPNALR